MSIDITSQIENFKNVKETNENSKVISNDDINNKSKFQKEEANTSISSNIKQQQGQNEKQKLIEPTHNSNGVSVDLIKNKYKKTLSVRDDLVPQMTKIVQMTIDSVRYKLNKKNRKHCFLVLGYDFIIDENFKVWLLEVNKNSGLSISSDLVGKIIPRMIDDCVKLTVDAVFETENSDRGLSRFPVEGYSDKENMWTLVDMENI